MFTKQQPNAAPSDRRTDRRSYKPGTVDSRAISGNFVQVTEASGVASSTLLTGTGVTFFATLTTNPAFNVLPVFQTSLFMDNKNGAYLIPYGASVDPTKWVVSWNNLDWLANDPATTPPGDYTSATTYVTVVNNTGGTHTVYFAAACRYIVKTTGVSS